jgi:hypothetical protein
MQPDFQARVAARRAQLASEAQELARLEKEAAERKRQDEQDRKIAMLDSLASELSGTGTPVVRHGERLEIAEPSPLEHLDPEDFNEEQLKNMLDREARRRWTPAENWLFIAPLTAGLLLLLPVFALGLILLVASVAYWLRTSDRYRTRLRLEFPQLFAAVGSTEARRPKHAGARLVQRELDSLRALLPK